MKLGRFLVVSGIFAFGLLSQARAEWVLTSQVTWSPVVYRPAKNSSNQWFLQGEGWSSNSNSFNIAVPVNYHRNPNGYMVFAVKPNSVNLYEKIVVAGVIQLYLSWNGPNQPASCNIEVRITSSTAGAFVAKRDTTNIVPLATTYVNPTMTFYSVGSTLLEDGYASHSETITLLNVTPNGSNPAAVVNIGAGATANLWGNFTTDTWPYIEVTGAVTCNVAP